MTFKYKESRWTQPTSNLPIISIFIILCKFFFIFIIITLIHDIIIFTNRVYGIRAFINIRDIRCYDLFHKENLSFIINTYEYNIYVFNMKNNL